MCIGLARTMYTVYHIYTNIPCKHVGYRNAGEGGLCIGIYTNMRRDMRRGICIGIYTNIPCMHVGYRNAGEGGCA